MDNSPRARFKRWLESTGSEAGLARRLGCHPSYPGKILAGRRPGLEVAHAIERESAKDAWGEAPIRTEEWLDESKPDASEPTS